MQSPIKAEKAIRILEASEKALLTKEIKDFNFRNIAKNADVNLALINYYFQNKAYLLKSVYQFSLENSSTQLGSVLGMAKNKNAVSQLKNCLKIVFDMQFKHYFLKQNILSISNEIKENAFQNEAFEKVVLEQITEIILLSLKTNTFSNLENPKMVHAFLIGTLQHIIKDFYSQTEINFINFERHLKEFQKQYLPQLQKMTFLFLGVKD